MNQTALTARLLETVLTAKLLEAVDPGPGRFWRVELVKNAAKDPIKVSLMKSMVEGRRAFSEPLAYTRTIATPEAVADAADKVLVMVGGYEDVVGDYPIEKGGK